MFSDIAFQVKMYNNYIERGWTTLSRHKLAYKTDEILNISYVVTTKLVNNIVLVGYNQ